jgi:hypothetical protein
MMITVLRYRLKRHLPRYRHTLHLVRTDLHLTLVKFLQALPLVQVTSLLGRPQPMARNLRHHPRM